MARKRKRCDNSGETGHDDEVASVTETERQRSENSKLSTSAPDLEARKRQWSELSRKSLFSMEQAKKRSSETFKSSASTPNSETGKLDICTTPEERRPGHQHTAFDEMYERSSFSPKLHTPTPENVRRKRKYYSEESGHEYVSTPMCDVRGNRQDSEVAMRTPDERWMRARRRAFGNFGLDHEHRLNYKAKTRITQGPELPVCTPISEILERDAHCGPFTPPLSAKPAKSQKKLFCGPSDEGTQCGADEEEKRGWALDRRRTGLDHGKFTEDELISLNCGLNELMQARKWTREEAARILTYSNGRGRPHVEARGAWKEIAKYLPSSSIVRVNMKARSLLFTGKTGRWHAEETKLLKRLVQTYDNDWISISFHLGRSNGACARKWRTMRLEDCTTRKKGKWTQEEYAELCRHVRDAKAAKVTTSKKVGNRKVRDNLQWEPIAVKMCRPANQCSAVWYERLAPSMYKEACLDVKDRQWTDEDDRRLLKKMLKLMSRHGEISWPNISLRNRKTATCKARYNQMTHRRCLEEKSEATVEEQLEILVRRYAPELIIGCRRDLDECNTEAVGEILKMGNEETCQPRNGEHDLEPTDYRREENEWTMHPLNAREESVRYESDLSESLESGDEHEGSMVQLRIEEGNSAVSRNSGIEDKGSGYQCQKKKHSCKFEERIDLIRIEEDFDSGDRKCEISKSSLERDEEDAFSVDDEERHVDSPRRHRRVEQVNTSRRYILGKIDERMVDRGRRRMRDEFAENYIKLNQSNYTQCIDETINSLECQNFEKGIQGKVFLHLTNDKRDRGAKKKLYDSEDQGSRCEPLINRMRDILEQKAK